MDPTQHGFDLGLFTTPRACNVYLLQLHVGEVVAAPWSKQEE
jgi:hypothetical protein